MAYNVTDYNEVNGIIERINYSKNLTSQMKAEERKYTKLAELAFIDELDTIKKSITYAEFTFAVQQARDWLDVIKDSEVDKKEHKDEESCYNYLISKIKDKIIGDNEINITKINKLRPHRTNYILDWIVCFTYNDKTFWLCIPELSYMNSSNSYFIDDGKLRLYWVKNNNETVLIESSYDENDLKIAFNKFLEPEIVVK